MTRKRTDGDNNDGEIEATNKLRRVRPSSPSPEEGRRLVVAFMGIKNAAVRDAIINLIERMSPTDNDPM